MIEDKFGGVHSTGNIAAVTAFSDAVFAVAAHRPIGDALQRALQLEPGLVAAHALLGLGNVILGRHETVAAAAPILANAEVRLAGCGGGSQTERALVGALRLATNGQLKSAADTLTIHLRDHPLDFLSFKICHALRFMCGQAPEMLAVTAGSLPSWSKRHAAFGFVLGCHAFGLEEAGHYAAAEAFGREAYAAEAADAWGLHAVSHVMEMSGRTQEGSAWLDGSRPDWTQCNNFSYHLGWHLALFKLEEGDTAAVLDLYDKDIRPLATDDFRDMANATSILWRLELHGVPAGERWSALHEIAAKRRRDLTYVFGSLHYLLALVACGDHRGASDLLLELKNASLQRQNEQAQVAANVGLPVAEAIMALVERRQPNADLVKAAAQLNQIGGSHAQRDVFLRTLLMTAAENDDIASVAAISRIRQNLRSSDSFMTLIEKRLSSSGAKRRPAYPLLRAG